MSPDAFLILVAIGVYALLASFVVTLSTDPEDAFLAPSRLNRVSFAVGVASVLYLAVITTTAIVLRVTP